REGGHPTDGGDVLILFADRLAEAIDLELTRLFGELFARAEVALVRVERVQERDGEGGRRSEPRVRRNVGDAGHLDPLADARHPQRFAEDAMFDLLDVGYVFGLRIRKTDVVVKPLVRRDVNVLIDGGGDEIAAELFVVSGDVGPPAAQGKAH